MPLKIKRTALQFCLALFSILITLAADAQQRRVTGRILGADGTPVAGASISVAGTTTNKLNWLIKLNWLMKKRLNNKIFNK